MYSYSSLRARVRLNEEETEDGNMKVAQIAQNKMLRVLDNSQIRDRRSKKDMLDRFDLLSVILVQKMEGNNRLRMRKHVL